MKKILILVIALFLCFPIVAFSDTDSKVFTLRVGESLKINYNKYPFDTGDNNFKWTTSDSKICTVSSGTVRGISPGTAQITITSTTEGYTDTCTVNVVSTAKGVEFIEESVNMNVGDTHKLNYNLIPADGYDDVYCKDVSWSSSDSSVASVSGGTVTAKKEGMVSVTITTKDGGYKDIITISVKSTTTGISLNTFNTQVYKGSTYQLNATVYPDTSTCKKVTWKSSDSSVASVSNGNVTARNVGSAIITATTVDGGYSVSCKITVLYNPDVDTAPKSNIISIPVQSVKFLEDSIALRVTETKKLQYVMDPVSATKPKYTWSIKGGAPYIRLSGSSVTGVAPGVAIVTLTINDKSADCTITVESTVNGITLPTDEMYLNVGQSFDVDYSVLPYSAYCKDVLYTFSDKSIASISGRKITGLKEGTTILTLVTKDGGYSASCTVHVKSTVSGVSVNPSTLNLNMGQSYQLSTMVMPDTAFLKTLKYSSSNSSVASVNQDGIVKGVKPGNATITAETKDGGYKDYCDVTVNTDLQKVEIVLPSGKGEPAYVSPISGYTKFGDTKTINDPDKEWKITFNKSIVPGSVNDSNLFLTDFNNNKISSKISLSTDLKKVFIRPENDMDYYKKYRLYIGGNIKSADNHTVSKYNYIEFIVSKK